MVDTMHYDEFLPSASGDGWQAVELPYVGDEVSMFVVVPDDLGQFEAALTSELRPRAEPRRVYLPASREGGGRLNLTTLEYVLRSPDARRARRRLSKARPS